MEDLKDSNSLEEDKEEVHMKHKTKAPKKKKKKASSSYKKAKQAIKRLRSRN